MIGCVIVNDGLGRMWQQDFVAIMQIVSILSQDVLSIQSIQNVNSNFINV